ncbi:hypothetical protein BD324DRAFT_648180 [Kockovaella imperatae]|uniref:Uncharacterized protein n=1 Tax=Kockovaella imperatae TaxID=4999 RepID=A0A1Y1UTF5_9TREE|nr:hypothetical protein BD324DRAFT_648180 [Kockovaella imperatae]ORX41309.1 hypothetical protein BD324DRAFT_648180 [Kockovaella imperatae]
MREREMNAVDWGHDMIAACTDDAATRIWRRDDVTALKLKNEPESMTQEWAGHVA